MYICSPTNSITTCRPASILILIYVDNTVEGPERQYELEDLSQKDITQGLQWQDVLYNLRQVETDKKTAHALM